LSKGLNKPVFFKLFSTTLEISKPRSFISNSFSRFFLSPSVDEREDTATGKGFRLPLVISTSIKAKDFRGKVINSNIVVKKI